MILVKNIKLVMVENFSWKWPESKNTTRGFTRVTSVTAGLVFAIMSHHSFAQEQSSEFSISSFNYSQSDIPRFIHHDKLELPQDFDEPIAFEDYIWEDLWTQKSIMFQDHDNEDISWEIESDIKIEMDNLCDNKWYKMKVDEHGREYMEVSKWRMWKALAKNIDCKYQIADIVAWIIILSREKDKAERDEIKMPKKKNKLWEFAKDGFKIKWKWK